MAVITDLKLLLDLYGVGVRAGVLTPQVEDETYFRNLIDLPNMSGSTVMDWKNTGNVRHPITIAPTSDTTAPQETI
jgi:hypothetical protein